jgi:hypothetical protein
MADPYRQNKSGVYSVDTPHSAIDDLIATNDLKQFSDSDKNRLYEFLFGPQDMELDMGFAPDLALSPLISKKGIMSTLKNLFGKNKSKSKFPVGYGEPTKEAAVSSSYDDVVEVLKDIGFGESQAKGTFAGIKNLTIKQQDDLARKLQEAGIKIDDKGAPYNFKTDVKESWSSVNKRFKEITDNYLNEPVPFKTADEIGVVEKKIWK